MSGLEWVDEVRSPRRHRTEGAFFARVTEDHMVAVPTPQHSPMFRHLASAQTVLRSSRSMTSAMS